MFKILNECSSGGLTYMSVQDYSSVQDAIKDAREIALRNLKSGKEVKVFIVEVKKVVFATVTINVNFEE